MPRRALLALALALVAAPLAAGETAVRTICTITVNSSDEKQTLAARLPPGRYKFEELVESGRADWLRSACKRGVKCDVLVISGHFNAGETFYSDRVDAHDHLAVDELERAACSDSCPGLFANLKEVYLFGCESLNPDATKYSSAYGESGRERMRRIFAGVPGIYGFSSSAPVGPTAAMLLNRYFDAAGARDFGTGRTNGGLLQAFKRNSMTQVSGVREGEAAFAQRGQVCRFFDERTDAARKLAFVHELLRGDPAEARRFFRRMEKLFEATPERERRAPAFQQVLARIAADEGARAQFLRTMREATPGERARLIELAVALQWLKGDDLAQERVTLAQVLLRQARPGHEEIDIACAMDPEGTLATRLPVATGREGRGQAAIRACLGDGAARNATLAALASDREADVGAAQAYLRHRPASAEEVRTLAARVGRMPASPAQVRAFEALARLNIADRDAIAELTQAYAIAGSAPVQRAIAEVFLRADLPAEDKPEIAAILQERRIPQRGGGGDLIDVLIRQLAPAS